MLSTKQSLRVHLIDEEAEKLSAGYILKNTKKANKMAVENYEEWRKWRNEQWPQDQVPSCTELLPSSDAILPETVQTV